MLIQRFAKHKVAANTFMAMLLVFGLWGLRHINLQLSPTQVQHQVELNVAWPGASAERVREAITLPFEHQLRSLKGLEEFRSSSTLGRVEIIVEFNSDVLLDQAVDDVRQAVAQVENLPPSAEPPIIKPYVAYEALSDLLIIGGDLEKLEKLADKFEKQLLNIGVDKIEPIVFPQAEIIIEASPLTVLSTNFSLSELAERIQAASADIPVGLVGSGDGERQLRGSLNVYDPAALKAQVILDEANGNVRLEELVDVRRRWTDSAVHGEVAGQPVIWLRLLQAPGSDIAIVTDELEKWLAQTNGTLSEGVQVAEFLEAWEFTQTQLDLVVENGFYGLLLVLVTLYLFLSGRIAFWVSAGIPVVFISSVALFYYAGGSINPLSLVGLIMALGIVVDDAIVVGEQSQAFVDKGMPLPEASSQAAIQMAVPLFASSLTTIAAFIPLILIDGGTVREIPLIISCIILISLVECFLILPGHLNHRVVSREKTSGVAPAPTYLRHFFAYIKNIKAYFEHGLSQLEQRYFAPILSLALKRSDVTLACASVMFMLAISLLIGGKIKTDLVASFGLETITANIKVVEDTNSSNVDNLLFELEKALRSAEKETEQTLIKRIVVVDGQSNYFGQRVQGEQFYQIVVELVAPQHRDIDAFTLSDKWSEHFKKPLHLEYLHLVAGQNDGADLSIYFQGADLKSLKEGAQYLQMVLNQLPEVYNVSNDLVAGQQQWIVEPLPEGRALGLDAQSLTEQLASAYHGVKLDTFYSDGEETELWLRLSEQHRQDTFSLSQFPIKTSQGTLVPLGSVAKLTAMPSAANIQHHNGLLAVNISADINRDMNTPSAVLQNLEDTVIPEIVESYGLTYGLTASSAAEQRLVGDLLAGVLIGLILMYLILVWVFESYVWPIVIMTTIPLALTGAFFGLALFDFSMGVLSVLGLFTVSGVIINDAIILISRYKSLSETNKKNGIYEAVISRFRPVLLTSLTTSIGLLPMLFETSAAGAFMKPLAVVICCGMGYATVLVLLVIPCLFKVLLHYTDYHQENTATLKDEKYQPSPTGA